MQMTDQSTPLRFLNAMANNRAKLLATLGGGLLIFLIWQFSLILVGRYVGPVTVVLIAKADNIAPDREALGVFLLLILGFSPAFLVMLAWRRIMERRAVLSLFTASRRFRWSITLSAIVFVTCLGLGLTTAFDAAGKSNIAARFLRLSFGDWSILFCGYGVGIAIQATFEEVFLRGWLAQHLSRFLLHSASCVVVSAMIFSVLHAGASGWATYAVALVSGLAFGWSTLRLNGLEAAIGAHIGNNLVAALFGGGMIRGNNPTMTMAEIVIYFCYILGFLLFVELWARAFPAGTSRA